MKEILVQYANILLAQFQYDVQVLSTHPWMSYWVIPALFYAVFMFVKWGVLTIPVWVPTLLMSRAVRGWPIEIVHTPKGIKYAPSKN